MRTTPTPNPLPASCPPGRGRGGLRVKEDVGKGFCTAKEETRCAVQQEETSVKGRAWSSGVLAWAFHGLNPGRCPWLHGKESPRGDLACLSRSITEDAENNSLSWKTGGRKGISGAVITDLITGIIYHQQKWVTRPYGWFPAYWKELWGGLEGDHSWNGRKRQHIK